MTENVPNLERGKTMQVQEALKVSVKMNPKSPTPNEHYMPCSGNTKMNKTWKNIYCLDFW